MYANFREIGYLDAGTLRKDVKETHTSKTLTRYFPGTVLQMTFMAAWYCLVRVLSQTSILTTKENTKIHVGKHALLEQKS